nr:hypothetical protein [Tanacetum cinerariifolium]
MKIPQNLKDFMHSINTTQTKNKGIELKKKRGNEVNKNIDTKVNGGQKKDCKSNQSVKKRGSSEDRKKVDDLNKGDGCVGVVTDEHVTPSPCPSRDNVDEKSKSEIGTKCDSVKKGGINEELVTNEKNENVTGTLFRKFFVVVNDNKIDNKLEVICTVIDENGNEMMRTKSNMKIPQNLKDFMHSINTTQTKNKGTELKKKRGNEVNKNMDTKVNEGQKKDCESNQSVKKRGSSEDRKKVDDLNKGDGCVGVVTDEHVTPSPCPSRDNVDEKSKSEIGTKCDSVKKGGINEELVVELNDEMIEIGCQKWQKTAFGFFVGWYVTYSEARYHLRRMWNKFGFIDLNINEGDVFFFKFHDEGGMDEVVKNRAEPNKLPMCVKILNVPMEAWSIKGISALASSIWKPIIMDDITAKTCAKGLKRMGQFGGMGNSSRFGNKVDVVKNNARGGKSKEMIMKEDLTVGNVVVAWEVTLELAYYGLIDLPCWTLLDKKELIDAAQLIENDENVINKNYGNINEKRKSAFRFSYFITEKNEFLPIVRDVWNKRIKGCNMAELLRDEVKECQRKVDSLPHDEKVKEESCRILEEYQQAIKEEYKRVHRGRIMAIRNDEGIRFENEDVAKQIVPLMMVRQVSDAEIKNAMFEIDDSKAPGPDGYTARDLVRVIKKLLDEFTGFCGLLPNMQKSTIFFGGLSTLEHAMILDIVPFTVERLPMKYLGAVVFLLPKQVIYEINRMLKDSYGAKATVQKESKGMFMMQDQKIIIQLMKLFKIVDRFGQMSGVLILISLDRFGSQRLRRIVKTMLFGSLVKFKIREVWKDLCSNNAKVDWCSMLWFPQAIHRHAFVLCIPGNVKTHAKGFCTPSLYFLSFNRESMDQLATKKGLMTQDRMALWRPNDNLKCALCGQCADSHNHLFFSCEFPKVIWKELNQMLNVRLSDSWDLIINDMIALPMNNNIWCIVRRLVIAAAVYFVWKERNDRLFKNEIRKSETIISTAKEGIRLKLMGMRVKESRTVNEVEKIWNVKFSRNVG